MSVDPHTIAAVFLWTVGVLGAVWSVRLHWREVDRG